MIRFFWDEQFDGFAGTSFDDKRALYDLIGNVVGSYDGDACIRFLNNGEDFLVEWIAKSVRSAGHYLNRAELGSLVLFDCFNFSGLIAFFTTGECPIGFEDGGKLHDGWAFDEETEVFPAFAGGGGTHIFATDVSATDYGSFAVEDREFSMIAEIGFSEGGEREDGHKSFDFSAGFFEFQHVECLFAEGTNCVEK